jgi:hypothetical protein
MAYPGREYPKKQGSMYYQDNRPGCGFCHGYLVSNLWVFLIDKGTFSYFSDMYYPMKENGTIIPVTHGYWLWESQIAALALKTKQRHAVQPTRRRLSCGHCPHSRKMAKMAIKEFHGQYGSRFVAFNLEALGIDSPQASQSRECYLRCIKMEPTPMGVVSWKTAKETALRDSSPELRSQLADMIGETE